MTTDPLEVAKAGAEASKATAETAGKAIDAARATGSFLDKIFGGALEELGATWKEKVAFYRWNNMLSIMDKVEKIRAERSSHGKATPISPIAMGTAIPLLDKASLEDDPDLQDMWATLITNTAEDPNMSREAKTYAEILAGLTPNDARVLLGLARPMERSATPPLDSREDIDARRITFENLIRLGCAEYAPDRRLEELIDRVKRVKSLADLSRISSIPGRIGRRVQATSLGRAVIDACTMKSQSDEQPA
jgi:hypothetical protein